MAELPLNAGTLPAPYTCWQPLYNLMFSLGSADGPTVTGVLIQDAVPDASDHDKGWIPTAAGVPRYPGYIFVWHNIVGHWVSRNPIAASDDSRRIYVGTLASIDTYDGGDGSALGPAGGPMWTRDTLFDGRMPIGVGAIPTSSPVATIGNPLDTSDSLGNSGEYKHVLTGAEGAVADHKHPIGNGDPGTGDIGLNYETPAVTTPAFTEFGNTGGGPIGIPVTQANLLTLKANNGAGVVSDGHNNMSPYIGVFIIKRTSRQFYVAA